MSKPVAVIDIGSNSVRLVMYDGVKRHLHPFFNEKVLCGLGKGLADKNRLPKDGKASARKTIRRFIALTRARNINQVYIIATAAIRDAEDGREFIAELEQENNVKIRIISGERKRILLRWGSPATTFDPKGLVGDLGGGGFELIEVHGQRTGASTTLPLGSLRMLALSSHDEKMLRRMVQDYLRAVPWLTIHPHKTFYAVGGSFRSVARVHMRKTDYPLRILHQYEISAAEVRKLAQEVLAEKPQKLKGLRENRSEGFIPALILLDEIIGLCKIEKIVFSTGGIREGLLFDLLPDKEKQKDPLQASVEDILSRAPVDAVYATALKEWIAPLFKAFKEKERLINAFVALSEVGLTMHQEFRAAWGFDHVLYSSAYGLTHRERVMLSLALYYRHRYKLKLNHPALALVSEKDKLWSYKLGQAASLASEISADAPEILSQVRLSVSHSVITLKPRGSDAITLPDTVEKRLEGLSEALRARESFSK
ncbi:MAG: hypothetical protein U1E36_09815 [Rickettsiales bacterium]